MYSNSLPEMYGLLNKIMDTWLNGYMVKWLCVGVGWSKVSKSA